MLKVPNKDFARVQRASTYIHVGRCVKSSCQPQELRKSSDSLLTSQRRNPVFADFLCHKHCVMTLMTAAKEVGHLLILASVIQLSFVFQVGRAGAPVLPRGVWLFGGGGGGYGYKMPTRIAPENRLSLTCSVVSMPSNTMKFRHVSVCTVFDFVHRSVRILHVEDEIVTTNVKENYVLKENQSRIFAQNEVKCTGNVP